MRALLVFACLALTCFTAIAQYRPALDGSYVRYKYIGKGRHTKQTLVLTGARAGRYTLDKKGTDMLDITSGDWKAARIWQRRRDSLDVVILDPENKFDARYLEIERTGCLTPVDDDGYRRKHANSFMPVDKNSKAKKKLSDDEVQRVYGNQETGHQGG